MKHKMVVMEAIPTLNDFEITEESILNSLQTFTNKPIVLINKDDDNDKGIKIGYIEEATYYNEIVLAQVNIYDEYDKYYRVYYDNWQITYDETKEIFDSFIYDKCYIFKLD